MDQHAGLQDVFCKPAVAAKERSCIRRKLPSFIPYFIYRLSISSPFSSSSIHLLFSLLLSPILPLCMTYATFCHIAKPKTQRCPTAETQGDGHPPQHIQSANSHALLQAFCTSLASSPRAKRTTIHGTVVVNTGKLTSLTSQQRYATQPKSSKKTIVKPPKSLRAILDVAKSVKGIP